MGKDPKIIIDEGAMHLRQWLAVLITVGLNALDGFDVLSISFASPGIAKEWGVDKSTLGWILSMELLGMGVGSLLLGGIADKIGRRPMILCCLTAMAIGMFGAAGSHDTVSLLPWRLLTGFGIGGMLASINAAVAELSNRRWRSLATALMVIGYPIGGIVGGLVVQGLLVGGSWRAVFAFGAWATAAFIPLVLLLVPESVAFLARRRRLSDLDRIHRTLALFGHVASTEFDSGPVKVKRGSIAEILKPGMVGTTLLVTMAYVAHITSFYFMIKWIPKIVVDLGFAPKAAASVLTWSNVGGAIGGALYGLIATRVSLRPLTMVTLVMSFITIIWFGQGAQDLGALTQAVIVASLFTNSAVVGLYSLIGKVFATHVRATGTGFVIGVGRAGAAFAPIAGGYLFQAGLGLGTVATIMGVGSLISAATLIFLRERTGD
jgi:MFS family permease